MAECVRDFYVLNGNIKPCKEFDEKYIKEGKSLYEVIRVINGIPLYLEKHLNRLVNTADLTEDKLWITTEEIYNGIIKLIEVNKITIGNIKIVFNFNSKNNYLIYFVKHNYPSIDMYDNGVKTILYHGERISPNAKVIDNSFRTSVNMEIGKNNAYEAILVDRNGHITEGSKSNIFMIKGEKVITAPLGDVLPGVTRGVIIDICKELGLSIIEKKVHYTEVKDLDALFISGTSPRVLPISQVNSLLFKSSYNDVLNCIKNKYNQNMEEYICGKNNVLDKD